MSALNELSTLRKRGAATPTRKGDGRAAAFFLAPWFLGLALITAGPLLASGYLSFTGAMQQLGSAVGAMSTSLLLTERAGRIDGMDRVGWLALAATLTLTPLVVLIGRLRRTRLEPAVGPV